MTNKVGIIGNGWVGKAMQSLFPDAIIYVRDPVKAEFETPDRHFTDSKDEINSCGVVFICVPTPNRVIPSASQSPTQNVSPSQTPSVSYSDIGEGRLDTSIVEECIKWLDVELIVVRSTVNPGDCDRWALKYLKNIVMQPEYLGETPSHPLLDVKATPFMILGGHSSNTEKLINLYTQVYNANVNIRQVTAYEAEVIKLTENRAIAFKVAQAQELYDVCKKLGLNYYTIREAVYRDDPRFNTWWTMVFPEKRGFVSKCIPKDVYAWADWAESLGYEPKITRAILEKNKEWLKSNAKSASDN